MLKTVIHVHKLMIKREREREKWRKIIKNKKYNRAQRLRCKKRNSMQKEEEMEKKNERKAVLGCYDTSN